MTETDIAALVAEIKSMAEGGMCAQEADILALIADWERRGKEIDALREEVEDTRASLDRMSCAEFALSARIAVLEHEVGRLSVHLTLARETRDAAKERVPELTNALEEHACVCSDGFCHDAEQRMNLQECCHYRARAVLLRKEG